MPSCAFRGRFAWLNSSEDPSHQKSFEIFSLSPTAGSYHSSFVIRSPLPGPPPPPHHTPAARSPPSPLQPYTAAPRFLPPRRNRARRAPDLPSPSPHSTPSPFPRRLERPAARHARRPRPRLRPERAGHCLRRRVPPSLSARSRTLSFLGAPRSRSHRSHRSSQPPLHRRSLSHDVVCRRLRRRPHQLSPRPASADWLHLRRQ